MAPFTMTTERLSLRPFQAHDIDDALAYASDEAFGRFVPTVPYPYGRHDAEAFVASAMETDWSRAPHWAIALDGRAIGGVNLAMDEENTAALGYAIGRAWWGQGLGTEVARAAVDCAFERYRVAVVWATADARNTPSRRVLEKVGMRLDGVLRQRRLHRGERCDECHYGILRTEWEASSRRSATPR